MTKNIISLIILFSYITISYSQKTDTLSIYKTDNKVIYGICFTDKGEALAIADNNTIKVYSTNSKELISEFENGHKGQILTIDISKDSTLLVSGGKDSTIVIWDFINKKILKSLKYHKGIITSIKISSDGRFLASGGTDKKVYLFDLKLNQVLNEFADTDIVTSVTFSPDGELIVTAGADRLINVYSVESGKLLKSFKGNRSWIRDIDVSKNGTMLISCGDDSRIIIWNISDINRIRELDHSRFGFNWLLSASFNKDSKTYVLSGMDGSVRIIGQFFKYTKKIGVPINKVLFKPNEGDNFKIALATKGKGVVLIDAKNMKFEK